MDTHKRTNQKADPIWKGIDRELLANALKTKRNVIDQIASGHLRVSPARARKIERATFGRVPASKLRPDIFGEA